jgi:hypothetical protein
MLSLFSSVLLILRGLCPRDNNFIKYYELIRFEFHRQPNWNTCTVNNLGSLTPIRFPRTCNGRVWIMSAFVVGDSVDFIISCTASDWLSLLDIEYHVGTLWNTCTVNNLVSLIPMRIPRTLNGMVWIQSDLIVGESVIIIICCTAFDCLSLLDIDAWLQYWDCNWSW